MGEERKIDCHLSAAPTVGAAFITNGKILDPWFGIGFRVVHIQLSNDREDGNPPEESSTTTGAAALSVRASLLEYQRPDVCIGLLGGGSLLVGGFFGFAGYAGLRIEVPIKKKK